MSIKTVDVNASSVEAAFEQSGMSWSCEQSEMLNVATGKTIEDKKILYRSDTSEQLGVVGSNYGIVQNTDCFAFFNTICKDHNANICKISEYRGGAVIHMIAEVKDKNFNVRKGDEVGFRFNLWNGFDGIHTSSVTFSIFRLACLNGLVTSEDYSIKMRHSKNAVNRIEQAIKVWAGGEKWVNDFKSVTEKLVNKLVDKATVEKFLNAIYSDGDSAPIRYKKNKTLELFEAGKGNGEGTMWDLYNGVTEFIDHYSKKDEESLVEYANIGDGVKIKSKAYDVAFSMSK